MTNAQGSRGKQAVGLTAVAPLQLTGDRRSAFEGYLSKAITRSVCLAPRLLSFRAARSRISAASESRSSAAPNRLRPTLCS
jgi:hypothetical protein